MAQRMQQTMPEDRTGWHVIDAGPELEILFHPNRKLAGREDEIVRPSIVVAVAGKREQALRFDPFSMGAHYHIRPGLAEQIPLPLDEGQNPVDATLAFFEKPLRFRGLLALAEEDDVADDLDVTHLANAAGQIRAIHLQQVAAYCRPAPRPARPRGRSPHQLFTRRLLANARRLPAAFRFQ